MQISISLLLGCAAVLCILPPSVRAADTEAQAKAREALRQKLNELQPPPAGVTSAAPVAPIPDTAPVDQLRSALRQKMNEPQEQPPALAPATPAKTAPRVSEAPAPRRPRQPKPAPVKSPTPVQPAPTPEIVAPPPMDSEVTVKEREAIRKKMEELQVQPPPEMAVRPSPKVERTKTPSAPKPMTPSEPVQVARPIKSGPRFQEPPTVTPSPAATASQPTLAPSPGFAAPAAPNSEVDAMRAAQTQAATEPQAEKKSKTRRGRVAPAFPQLQGPPLSISAEKQQRLQELLRRYQADEISPAQYHEERAKILAGS